MPSTPPPRTKPEQGPHYFPQPRRHLGDRLASRGDALPPSNDQPFILGEIKWFGGYNNKTGRENDFGFIAAPQGDLYFHVEQAQPHQQSLAAGTKVAFLHGEGRRGKPEARFVRVLSSMSDAELEALLKCQDWRSPQDRLTLILCRSSLESLETESIDALKALMATDSASPLLRRFWHKFGPTSLTSPLFSIAPDDVKSKVCQRHYADFKTKLLGLFSSVGATQTKMSPAAVYADLDERDEELALEWAERRDSDASLAKMLSARAAEKSAKKFYETVGLSVEDVSMMQLDGESTDWMTHDLLVDSNVAVDVKNARRPIHGASFFVEHTVARFKLDRNGKHVKIAGILSPYVNLKEIREPSRIASERGQLVFIGETCQSNVDQLLSRFNSDTFEVTRAHERTFPHWLFGYPAAWYRTLSGDVARLLDESEWPEEELWQYVFDDREMIQAIPALCLARRALPQVLVSKLVGWQVDFYGRVRDLIGASPHAPTIFLAVLADFLQKLVRQPSEFSPDGYLPLLFGERQLEKISFNTPSTPLGAIDPLGIVRRLVDTLGVLWENRSAARLEQFSNFRFVGLGLLQGRERNRSDWKTILAYCGGTVYGLNESGEVILGSDGKPSKVYGKCGNTPLVIGREKNCIACGKLVCGECGFCSLPCQQRQFAERVERSKQTRPNYAAKVASHATNGPAPEWDDIPLDVYEEELKRR